MYNNGNAQNGSEMRRMIGSQIIVLLKSFAQAWQLNSNIYEMKAEHDATYAWYLKDGNVSLVVGLLDNPTGISSRLALHDEPRLLVGKLYSANSFQPTTFNSLASFSLMSPDVFNEAAEWIDTNWQLFAAYS
jgi:hypothetical protein